MKPFKNILILLIVILLLFGGLYAVIRFEPATDETETPALPSTVSIFKTEKNQIQSVTVTNPEETYTLVKNGEEWSVSGEPAVKLSASRVESFLYECANVTGKELVTDNAENLAQYGLAQPERMVEISLENGTTTRILIGHATFEHSVSYLMVEGEHNVYTKSTSGCNTLTGNLEELMDTEIYAMDAADIGGITIERDGGETIVLDRVLMTQEGEEPAYQWTMLAPIQKEANTYRIEGELLTNLLKQTAVQVIPVPEGHKDYGFSKPTAKYTITSLDKKQIYTVTVGKEEGTNTYIRLADNHSVFLVATDKLDFLQLGYIDLIDKLIHVENIKEVSGVTLRGLGKTYRVEISEAEKKYSVNGKIFEETAFRKIYQSMIGLTLDDFSKNGNGGEIAFTITYDKNDGSQSVVSCMNFDERNYLVKVNGQGNLLIRKKQIDNMVETIDRAFAE